MTVSIATKVAWSFLGRPYIWGGDDPIAGFDCSGFCIEILKSVGKLPRSGDWTASGLFDLFADAELHNPKEGGLVFWRSGTRICHVEYLLNSRLAIGASGGGSGNLTMEDAIANNAYIKIRPIHTRRNIAGFKDPFKDDR